MSHVHKGLIGVSPGISMHGSACNLAVTNKNGGVVTLQPICAQHKGRGRVNIL